MTLIVFVPGEPHDPEPTVDRGEPDVSFMEADEGIGSIRKGAGSPGIDRWRNEVANLFWAIGIRDVDDAQSRRVPGERDERPLLAVIHAQIVRGVSDACLKNTYGASCRSAIVIGQCPLAVFGPVNLQTEGRNRDRIWFM